jgi:nicotinamide riboside kinase
MRVYFVGAHSTGKTTLARYVSRKYGMTRITEMARAVLSEMESTFDAVRSDIDLVDTYQREVFQRQVSAEKGDFPKGFVSDRAFDNLAYAAEHSRCLAELIETQTFREYVEWVRGGVVFFVRPHKDLIKEDGVRETPVWDGMIRIDGMVKLLLEMTRVDYTPLESPLMQQRCHVVDQVLKRRDGVTSLEIPGASRR